MMHPRACQDPRPWAGNTRAPACACTTEVGQGLAQLQGITSKLRRDDAPARRQTTQALMATTA
eukprot:1323898-Pyramimonas_sp.AAC.1